jgi:hypothetical protein
VHHDLNQIARQAIADFGGPDAITPDMGALLVFFLRTVAGNAEAAAHAYAAAMSELQAKAMGVTAHIDVDRCTAHLIALREPGGATRFVPLTAIALIVGAATEHASTTTTTTPAPNANTIH